MSSLPDSRIVYQFLIDIHAFVENVVVPGGGVPRWLQGMARAPPGELCPGPALSTTDTGARDDADGGPETGKAAATTATGTSTASATQGSSAVSPLAEVALGMEAVVRG